MKTKKTPKQIQKEQEKQQKIKQFEKQLKAANLYSREHLETLKSYKQELKDMVERFEYNEDMSYHEIMVYANAKALMSLPEYQINLFITRTLIFKSSEPMAQQLGICRPTLIKYITTIKQKIRKNANAIIKSYTD